MSNIIFSISNSFCHRLRGFSQIFDTDLFLVFRMTDDG